VAVLAVVLSVLVGLAVWRVTRPVGPGLAAQAVVTASSTAVGYSAREAVSSGTATAPGAAWRSAGETTGAWLELSWSEPHLIRRVTLVRDAVDAPGVTAGYLSFGDGSFVQLRLSPTARATEVAFTPRSVDRLRFTASEVTDQADDVSLAEILVETEPAKRDVVSDDPDDGNAAPRATVTARTGDGAGGETASPHPLQDGAGASDLGSVWRTDDPANAWVQLTWDRPRELSSVELVGSADSAARLRNGTLLFDDGSELPLGAVLAEPDRPTIVSFMPRVTRSLRLTVDEVEGDGPLALSEWRTYGTGHVPWRPDRQPGESAPAENATCDPAVTAGLQADLLVLCPTTGALVGDTATISTRTVAGYAAVSATVLPGDGGLPAGQPVRATPDAGGVSELVVPLDIAGPGPVTVKISATGSRRPTRSVFLQLLRSSGSAPDEVAASTAAAGRTLAYAEEFEEPLTLSRTGAGADYAAAKPTVDGAQDFGDAIFPDPAAGPSTVQVVDGRYLRIEVEPAPAGLVDPQGWGRRHVGGLLASARQGGSGFSAQYGYFEARMLAPAVPGSWPAFWTLPNPNLSRSLPVEAEFDAVELYGHDPEGTCHATHSHEGGKDGGETRCGKRFSERAALAWHTYGVSVTPSEVTFYVDGRLVTTEAQVKGGDAPMYFLVNLALGGGWPLDLAGVQERATLYVDYVRVYV